MRYKSKKSIKQVLIEKYSFKLKEILRIYPDVSQEELAIALRTSAANVSKWINGKHLPKNEFKSVIDEYYEKAIRYEAEENKECNYGKETN